MTNRELLETYRSEVMALRDLETQLERIGTSGAPMGCRNLRMTDMPRGTNDPMHATLQLQDGLESIAAYKREVLQEMNPIVLGVLSSIGQTRLYEVIFYYYVEGLSTEEVAERTFLANRSVQRLKRRFLEEAGGNVVATACRKHVAGMSAC